MLPRERVLNMLEFKPVDKPALDCDISGVGLYEHGEKIRELFKSIGSDFNPISDAPIPHPPADAKDEDGNYLEYRTDEWGVETVYRIFGIQGHPSKRPLDDWANLKDYRVPPLAPAGITRRNLPGSAPKLPLRRKPIFAAAAGSACLSGWNPSAGLRIC